MKNGLRQFIAFGGLFVLVLAVTVWSTKFGGLGARLGFWGMVGALVAGWYMALREYGGRARVIAIAANSILTLGLIVLVVVGLAFAAD